MPLPLSPSWRLATNLPRLLTRGRLSGSITSRHLTSSWQPAATFRPCSTKAPQQEKTESTETIPAIAEKNVEVEVSSGPSLADMSKDVSYRPDNLDKRILVHYKYYPNMESVPEYVSQGQMNQAKSWARIKTANIMIATTVGLCLMTVIWAKSLMRQNSLVEENYRRHMKFKSKEEDGSQSSRMGLLTNNKQDIEENKK